MTTRLTTYAIFWTEDINVCFELFLKVQMEPIVLNMTRLEGRWEFRELGSCRPERCMYTHEIQELICYMQLFAFAVDVSLTNAWVSCRGDCKALAVDHLSLKNLRIKVFRHASSQKPEASHVSPPKEPSIYRQSLHLSKAAVCCLKLVILGKIKNDQIQF